MNSTVDLKEIAKFTALANEWWNPNGELKTLHDINPARLEFIEKNTPLSGQKVLDLGCGGGILSEALHDKGAIVTAIDMESAAINAAQKHAQDKTIQYKVCDVQELCKEQPESFDIVICMEMLEHVPNPKDILASCKKLLKPSGYAYFSTLNRNVKSYMLGVIAAEYLLRLLPTGTHDYGKFIKPSELLGWARELGFTGEKISGIHYNPLTRKATLTSDASINYMMLLRNS